MNFAPGIACKDNEKIEKLEMISTNCDVNEFSCDDGTCIDISKKCNFADDCVDSSDEKMCDLLSMKHYGADYNPVIHDISFGEDEDIIAATVNMSMQFLSIGKIKEIEIFNTTEARFRLH